MNQHLPSGDIGPGTQVATDIVLVIQDITDHGIGHQPYASPRWGKAVAAKR